MDSTLRRGKSGKAMVYNSSYKTTERKEVNYARES